MIVLRIEDIDGDGPYIKNGVSRDDWGAWMRWEGHGTHNGHPAVWDDGGELRNKWYNSLAQQRVEYRFAFINEAQLLDWFNIDELIKLESLGFFVVKYKVSHKDVLTSTHQVAFKNATFVERSTALGFLDQITAP